MEEALELTWHRGSWDILLAEAFEARQVNQKRDARGLSQLVWKLAGTGWQKTIWLTASGQSGELAVELILVSPA